jgi:hypothetical protein
MGITVSAMASINATMREKWPISGIIWERFPYQ